MGCLKLSYYPTTELKIISDRKVLTYNKTEINNRSSYFFGFGSKEKDNEIKGEGNSYDFGARIYDPRLGRWLSLDPLMAKYPGMSPYIYTANNPILYIDQDGKDYGVYVNHDTKTIIVKQTIHTVKGGSDASNANIGASKWNAESGKWQYVVGTGDKAVTYEIKFELTVKEHEDATTRDAAFAADKSGEGNLFKTDALSPGLFGNTTEQTSGTGVGFNHVEAQDNETAKNRQSYAHEIGHTLGLDHFTDGLMEGGATRGEGGANNFVTLGNVSRMLSYAGVGSPIETGTKQLAGKASGDKATSNTVGTAPADFSTGSVQSNQSLIGPRLPDGGF